MKTKRIVIGVSAAVLLIAVAAVMTAYTLLLNKPFNIEKPKYIYVDTDDTADSVLFKIETTLAPKSMNGFKLLSKVYGYEDKVRQGAYKMNASMRTIDAFRKLLYAWQDPVRMIVPSTRTAGRAIKTLTRGLMTDSAAVASLLNDSAYIADLGFTAQTLPALFMPNTYEVYWNISPDNLVKRLKREYDRFWNAERLAKADSLSLTPIEVATLASIVEEETANKQEKSIVAGLYLNRLRKGIPLQADPTVKFAMQDFTLKRILLKHLEAESPYNTYKHSGLPPGPIRIPSIEGLESVLNYSHHNYLYMCAKEDFSGTHNFAVTLSEHNRNAARYQQELNRRKIR